MSAVPPVAFAVPAPIPPPEDVFVVVPDDAVKPKMWFYLFQVMTGEQYISNVEWAPQRGHKLVLARVRTTAYRPGRDTVAQCRKDLGTPPYDRNGKVLDHVLFYRRSHTPSRNINELEHRALEAADKLGWNVMQVLKSLTFPWIDTKEKLVNATEGFSTNRALFLPALDIPTSFAEWQLLLEKRSERNQKTYLLATLDHGAERERVWILLGENSALLSKIQKGLFQVYISRSEMIQKAHQARLKKLHLLQGRELSMEERMMRAASNQRLRRHISDAWAAVTSRAQLRFCFVWWPPARADQRGCILGLINGAPGYPTVFWKSHQRPCSWH